MLFVKTLITKMMNKITKYKHGLYTDYGHAKAKFQIICCPNSNPTPK